MSILLFDFYDFFPSCQRNFFFDLFDVHLLRVVVVVEMIKHKNRININIPTCITNNNLQQFFISAPFIDIDMIYYPITITDVLIELGEGKKGRKRKAKNLFTESRLIYDNRIFFTSRFFANSFLPIPFINRFNRSLTKL